MDNHYYYCYCYFFALKYFIPPVTGEQIPVLSAPDLSTFAFTELNDTYAMIIWGSGLVLGSQRKISSILFLLSLFIILILIIMCFIPLIIIIIPNLLCTQCLRPSIS